MHDESLRALEAEIERQNAEFETAKGALADLDDVEVEIPSALLDELDTATTTSPHNNHVTPLYGVRA